MPSEDAFVGRSGELAVLDQELARVRAGQPRLVWLTGEAGIGKTSLLHRFVDRLSGVRLLWGSGDEDEAELPYGVLSQLVAGLPPGPGRPARSDDLRPDADPLAVGAALLAEFGALQVERADRLGGRRRALGRRPLGPGPDLRAASVAERSGAGSAQRALRVADGRGELGPGSGPEPAHPTAAPRRPERRGPEKVVSGGRWPAAVTRGQPPAARTHQRSPAVRSGAAAGASPGCVAGDHRGLACAALACLAGPRAPGQGE